jgi:hypothetical protein
MTPLRRSDQHHEGSIVALYRRLTSEPALLTKAGITRRYATRASFQARPVGRVALVRQKADYHGYRCTIY